MVLFISLPSLTFINLGTIFPLQKIMKLPHKKEIKKILEINKFKKKETNEIEFTPMQIHYPNTIDSCKAIERIVSIENYMEGEVKFLQKDEYFNLLMKYIYIKLFMY